MATAVTIRSPTSAARPSAPRACSRALDTAIKDAALEAIAAALERAHSRRSSRPTSATCRPAARRGIGDALLDRLRLDEQRDRGDRRTPCAQIAALADPVGEVIDGRRLPNGLDVRKVRVPLGVVAVVYEARPNVTIDAAALCLKSGNAIVLRGSSSAAHSNAVLAQIAAEAAVAAGLPEGCVSLVAGGGREELAELATQKRDRRPDHPARRRGPEGGAAGGRDRAGDLRGLGQLPRLRRRLGADLDAGRGDRAQRQGPAPGRLQRGRDAARARADRGRSFLPRVAGGAARRRRARARRRAHARAGGSAGAADRSAAARRPTRRTGRPSTWR